MEFNRENIIKLIELNRRNFIKFLLGGVAGIHLTPVPWKIADDIAITSHGVPFTIEISAPLRADVIDPCKESDDILAQAPEIEDRFFVVPDIPHEDL